MMKRAVWDAMTLWAGAIWLAAVIDGEKSPPACYNPMT
jgi:hypothetical protein